MSKEASSEKVFYTNAGERLTLRAAVEQVHDFIVSNPEREYEVIIGSDSNASLSGSANFISSIVVRRIGNGAIYFWTRHTERFYNMRDRIQKETMQSILLAQECKSLLKEIGGEDLFWDGRVTFQCIHLDVGEYGPTKDILDSMTGLVRGYGFEPVIKPDSYGAFCVADRHT